MKTYLIAVQQSQVLNDFNISENGNTEILGMWEDNEVVDSFFKQIWVSRRGTNHERRYMRVFHNELLQFSSYLFENICYTDCGKREYAYSIVSIRRAIERMFEKEECIYYLYKG